MSEAVPDAHDISTRDGGEALVAGAIERFGGLDIVVNNAGIGRPRMVFNLTEDDLCSICRDPRRDASTICVVEDPLAVITLERTRIYKGLYHVLHGALDPLHGVTVEDLKIEELVQSVRDDTVREVILATNPNVEGDTTAGYLERRLAPLGVHVTRLARGLPVGGDLEYADEVTLGRALVGRREM